MSKFRTSILLISMLIIVVAASLLTVIGLYTMGAVVTEKTELIYSVSDEEKVYDGTPLVAQSYELISGELNKGHTATVEITGSQTDAGESQSSLSIKICDKDGYDVTGEYKISVINGLLNVSKREISVVLNDKEVLYNGTKVTFEDYTVTEGELVSGHKIAGSQSVQLITVNDALPDDLKPVVFDFAGNEVTKNYTINFKMGTIKVVPRPVSVKPKDVEKVYDGSTVYVEDVEIISGSLADGQYFKNIEINNGETGYVNVCTEVTRITKIAICQLIGNEEIEVTENYDLNSLTEGAVNILKRPLKITAKNFSWGYDGSEHSAENSDHRPLSYEGTAPGEDITSIDYAGKIKDVGTVVNTIAGVSLSAGASLDNYDITIIDGTLTVTARELNVITPTLSKTYDGEPLKGASQSRMPTGDNVVNGHKIILPAEDDLPEVRDVDIKPNMFEITVEDENGYDVTKNYNIRYQYGTIEVTLLKITVRTNTSVREYDTTELENTDITVYGKPVGFELEMTKEFTKITDVGRVDNEVEYKLTYQNDDVPGADYRIEYTYGYLEITPCTVNLHLNDLGKVYDGEPFTIDKNEALKDNALPKFMDKDDFVVELVQAEAVNAGNYSYKVKLASDLDAENFSLSFTNGTIIIDKCEVNVTLASADFDYNGEEHLPTADYITVEGVGSGNTGTLSAQSFTAVITNGVAKNAGTYYYTVKLKDISEEKNYILHIQNGEITVNKLPLSIALPVYNEAQGKELYTYNGNSQLPTTAVIEDSALTGSLLSKSDFKVVCESGRAVNVGAYSYTVQISDNEKAGNYELTVTGGTFKIIKSELSVVFTYNEYSSDYTAKEHELELNSVLYSVNNNVINRDNLHNYVELYTSKTIKDAGEYYFGLRFLYSDYASNFTLKINGTEGGEVKYTVTPVKFRLSLAVDESELSKDYDGEVFTLKDKHITVNASATFKYTHTLNVATVSANAGKYNFDLDSSAVRFFDEYGENISRNFEFQGSLAFGVTINQREITFVLEDYECTEMPLGAHEIDLSKIIHASAATPLLSDYRLDFTNVYPGLSGNTITIFDFHDIIIRDKEGKNVTENFDVTNYMGASSSIILKSKA